MCDNAGSYFYLTSLNQGQFCCTADLLQDNLYQNLIPVVQHVVDFNYFLSEVHQFHLCLQKKKVWLFTYYICKIKISLQCPLKWVITGMNE